MKNNQPDISRLTPEEKRKLLEKMLLKGARSDAPKKDAGKGFQYPEDYRVLQERFKDLEKYGCGNIYFTAAEGLNDHLTTINGRTLINYTSYNYIGLSGNPVVAQAAKDAIDKYGTSVSASRLASGERPDHRALEQALAEMLGAEDCLVFVGGYGTNETVIGHLMNTGDLILFDSYSHASIQDGCRLSGADVKPFPHNNWEALDTILGEQRKKYRQVLIVIEGVYSMDGDIPDLPRFVAVKKNHEALLMIDEAHSIGVLGRTGAGIGEYHAVDRQDVEIWMGTLSKSFASCGGYIADGAGIRLQRRHVSAEHGRRAGRRLADAQRTGASGPPAPAGGSFSRVMPQTGPQHGRQQRLGRHSDHHGRFGQKRFALQNAFRRGHLCAADHVSCRSGKCIAAALFSQQHAYRRGNPQDRGYFAGLLPKGAAHRRPLRRMFGRQRLQAFDN